MSHVFTSIFHSLIPYFFFSIPINNEIQPGIIMNGPAACLGNENLVVKQNSLFIEWDYSIYLFIRVLCSYKMLSVVY